MDKKRFQVFVSSTFEDLRDERQAAVEAILKTGHIPAGMELFTAGSQSQLAVIREWIKNSDIYMLILGGRYGSIEPTSGLSYTEVEFDYARELGKPFFAVVISDAGKEAKAKNFGTKAFELSNGLKYEAFRGKVTGQMCAFFDSVKDIKLAIFEAMPQLTSAEGLVGWIPANEITHDAGLGNELTRALQENRTLAATITELTRKLDIAKAGSGSFEEIYSLLHSKQVKMPTSLAPNLQDQSIPILKIFLQFADMLAVGVSNSANADEGELFLMNNVASHLLSLGLAEFGVVPPTVYWQRIRLSKSGIDFLTKARVKIAAFQRAQLLSKTAGDGSVSTDGAVSMAEPRSFPPPA